MQDPVTNQDVVDVATLLEEQGLLYQEYLNHGYVQFLDVLPRLIPASVADTLRCDYCIPDAARISYQGGTRKARQDAALIDYLVSHRHTSPLEMAQVKFSLRMPIFVMRQHVRHRTASLNEESARYSQLEADFYIPEEITVNVGRQEAQTAHLSEPVREEILAAFRASAAEQYSLYQTLLGDPDPGREVEGVPVSETASFDAYVALIEFLQKDGIAVSREQARMVLGTNVYTRCVWSCDWKNLMHYLHLRCDKHAQKEIRHLAERIRNVCEFLFPVSWARYVDNFVDGITLTGTERQLLANHLETGAPLVPDYVGWSPRRQREFEKKVQDLGVSP